MGPVTLMGRRIDTRKNAVEPNCSSCSFYFRWDSQSGSSPCSRWERRWFTSYRQCSHVVWGWIPTFVSCRSGRHHRWDQEIASISTGHSSSIVCREVPTYESRLVLLWNCRPDRCRVFSCHVLLCNISCLVWTAAKVCSAHCARDVISVEWCPEHSNSTAS